MYEEMFYLAGGGHRIVALVLILLMLPVMALAGTAHEGLSDLGLTLKKINEKMGTFHPMQEGDSLHEYEGDKGSDHDYYQIASLKGHGAVYATPHYLIDDYKEGFTAYCLEHTLPGPNMTLDNGEHAPKGPYVLVDMDTFISGEKVDPNDTSARYSAETMHALAWVLAHTYPFMALDRVDKDNEVWSRVAGQFAMREVIKQLEGEQYVRDYWKMDEFEAGPAPEEYLAYARWLAAEGIKRAEITGAITCSDQSLIATGSGYIGSVTLTTDADLIRIRKSENPGLIISGNNGGSDSNYYYVKSGDTISITSQTVPFTLSMESASAADEEARFLVGIPTVDEDLQALEVPIEGEPYKLQDKKIVFESVENNGSLTLRKDVPNDMMGDAFTFDITLEPSATVSNPEKYLPYISIDFKQNDDKSISGSVTLKKDEEIKIEKLPSGWNFTVTEKDLNRDEQTPGHYETFMTLNGEKVDSDTVSGTVSNAEETIVTVVCVNTLKTGGLTVKKAVSGPGKHDRDSFQVKVQLDDLAEGKKVNGTYGDMTFVDGVCTFELKDGAGKTATGLPVGLGYHITETDLADYEEPVEITGYIKEATTPEVITLENKRLTGALVVTKVVEGTGWPDEMGFAIEVTVEEEVNGVLGVVTCPGRANEAITFTNSKATFVLYRGAEARMDLPSGTSFKVKEKDYIYTGDDPDFQNPYDFHVRYDPDPENALDPSFWTVKAGETRSVRVINTITLAPKLPKTGDSSPLALYGLLMLVALAGYRMSFRRG